MKKLILYKSKKNFIVKSISSLLLFSIILFVNNCNAPRNNPLDPNNPDYNLSVIEGTVKRISFPNNPIAGVNVRWENEQITVVTNQNGYFALENIKRDNGWIVFQSNNFFIDSVFINWNGRQKVTLQTGLNAVPKLDSLEIYSIIINKFQFNKVSELFIGAHISDIDGENDIDSVFVSNSELNFKSILIYNPVTKLYEGTFTPLQLNVSSLDETIGKQFHILVKDLNERWLDIGSGNLKRVIKEEIEPSSPINNQTVLQPVTLKWKRFIPGFEFKFLVQVYTDQSPPELIWEKNEVSSDSISTQVTDSIPSGEYFWVIWAIDNFNDMSRSKPASFNIL